MQETQLALDITEARFPSETSFFRDKHFCVAINKVKTSCSNEKRKVLDQAQPLLCPAIMALGNKSCADSKALFEDSALTQDDQTTLKREVTEYAARNLAKLDVYYNVRFAKEYQHQETISSTTFIGSLGGLLGLFLGFSLLSLAEVAYFLVIGVADALGAKQALRKKKSGNDGK